MSEATYPTKHQIYSDTMSIAEQLFQKFYDSAPHKLRHETHELFRATMKAAFTHGFSEATRLIMADELNLDPEKDFEGPN